jgi:iron complex transport system substrate-binding protein
MVSSSKHDEFVRQKRTQALIFSISGILLLSLSCRKPDTNNMGNSIKSNEVQYAKGFSMSDSAGLTYVDVYNPWNKYKVLERYVFSDSVFPEYLDKTITRIHTPVEKAVYLSSTFLGMVELTNAYSTVVACSNANWVYDSILYQRVRNGQISDLGNDMTVSPEVIISAKPEVVMKYIYQGEEPEDKVIKGAGIPIVYNIEFMEQHPLGRAEWIKLVGVMTGKKKRADSVFNSIVDNYTQLKQMAAQVKSKPTVLHGSSYKGTWHVAGGKSYIAQLLRDAGARYYWYSDSTTGSIPVSFENIILRQRDADVWIGANAQSLNEILKLEPRCKIFRAFIEGNVYHYNKRISPNGGLDYYESGVVRPDLLLRDFLLILHPSLFELAEETTYWKKLE